MYHTQAPLGNGVDENLARCGKDFSLVRTSALSFINIKALTRMTKFSWWVDL